MSLIDLLQSPEGLPSATELSAGVSNVTLSNPADSSDQAEKLAINAITRSFMQCEQSTNIKRMQGVSYDDNVITWVEKRMYSYLLTHCKRCTI